MTELHRFARLSPDTKGSNSSQCVCKMRSIEVGGKEFQAALLPVSQTYPRMVEVRAIVSQTMFVWIIDIASPIRRRIGHCFASSSPRLAHSHGSSFYSIHFDEITVVIHCVLDRCLSSPLGHISHFFVYIAHLVDRPRRRFCRATVNTGGVDTPICRLCHSRLVMERGGPLGPAAQRREHEGMPSLGLVVPTASGRETEGSYP